MFFLKILFQSNRRVIITTIENKNLIRSKILMLYMFEELIGLDVINFNYRISENPIRSGKESLQEISLANNIDPYVAVENIINIIANRAQS